VGWSDVFFTLFIILLIIPQTRMPLQVGINRLKVALWSPRVYTELEMERVGSFDYLVRDIHGRKSIKGIGKGKITFLGFWATWCAPCIAELPSIQALYEDYGDEVDFMLVTKEEATEVQRFLERKALTLPVYVPLGEVPDVLHSKSLPTNYIIDGNGTILSKEQGAADWNSKKVRGLLDGLLAK